MKSMISFCFHHVRTVLLLFFFFLVSGVYAYLVIPKESYPDITVPYVVVNVTQKGISPQDAERLLLRPLETELTNLDGLKETTSRAFEGGAAIVLEFYAGTKIKGAMIDVRSGVDIAKSKLPKDADSPTVKEINLSLFPVIAVELSGTVPDRVLYQAAEKLKDRIENISEILKAPAFGKRDELVEIIVNPFELETYQILLGEVQKTFNANNQIIQSGKLENKQGSFMVKVSGLIEEAQDVQNMPIFSDNNIVVKFKDLAKIRSTFETPETLTRAGGKKTVVLEVSKRLGENIIETIKKVRDVVSEEEKNWHGQIQVSYAQDGSAKIKDRITELQNSIILAIILVMAVMILSLGTRSAWLVGLSIPGAFFMGIYAMYLLGYTLNMVVLFALILSIGMLVDGAIIVVEYADRKMLEGKNQREAYLEASLRMLWPVITSITTILVVFLPLLHWPGLVGEFMKYLPITLIATLLASLVMALFVIPVLGSLFGKVTTNSQKAMKSIIASESGPLEEIHGFTGWYLSALKKCLTHPWRILGAAFLLLVFILSLYKNYGKGVEFFPDVEVERAAYLIHARGNLSLDEKDALVRKVEQEILKISAFQNVYTKIGKVDDNLPQDVIGTIAVEFTNWQERPHANKVLDEGLALVKDIPGIIVEIQKNKPGPSRGKPIQINVVSTDPKALIHGTQILKTYLSSLPGLYDIDDNRPLPGIEWCVKIDRSEALKYGANILLVGNALQMLTRGFKVSSYRPDDTREEVDIVLRFPEELRSLDQIKNLRVRTDKGSIPIKNFVKIIPEQKVGTIYKINGSPYYKVQANVKDGFLADEQVTIIKSWLGDNPLPANVRADFQGEDQDQKETGAFLVKAFIISIFLIILILVTQFNSFFSAALVLSAVVLSTFGVFVGLLVTGQAFSIVMGGLGIIALSGIIVSNNIIFIDTFDILRKQAKSYEDYKEVILRTGAQRIRPVLLTKITAILGLLPILLRLDIDFIHGTITMGAPASAWWVQLATAIVFGLVFASLLTLIVTPCALMIRENMRHKKTLNR